MTRILGLANADYIHTVKWANYFASRGHDVHLVSFTPISESSRHEYHPTVTFEPWLIPTFHLKRFWITLAAVRRLHSIGGQRRPEIVHAHFLGPAAWFAAVARLRPLVIGVMGGGDIIGSSWRPSSIRERVLTPLALRRSDLVLCWSRNLARIVAPMVREDAEVHVSIGGVDLHHFRRSPESTSLRRSIDLGSDDFVLFSPRLFRPLSNIETIIRALPHVRREIPRARLLMVKHRAAVHPGHEAAMERLVDDLGVRSFVRFVPGVKNQEMPLYYNAADCTVSVAQTDGTPMTVFESLACETPAIILDLPDYDPALFVHGRTVIRVPDDSPQALAHAIVSLEKDSAMRENLRREGRAMVERHSGYEDQMLRVQRFYEKLVRAQS